MITNNLSQKGSPALRDEYKKIFGSPDGQIARELNKTAKYRDPQSSLYREPCAAFYSEATDEDLELLMSGAKEDFLKKCTYIDPKSLKGYNILLKSKNPDGTLNVRILDDYGKFLKEGQITPKNVIVLDNFSNPTTPMLFDDTEKIPHGEIVKRLIQKSNPFNNYEFIDISSEGNRMEPLNALREILQRVKNGEKIDVISASYASEIALEQIEKNIGIELKNKPMAYQKKIIKETFKKFANMSDRELEEHCKKITEDFTSVCIKNIKTFLANNEELQIYDELQKLGVKVFLGAGNGRNIPENNGNEMINYNLLCDGAQGVGALDDRHKAADYSSSRKTIFTPHYEKGGICVEFREGGFNFAGGAGVDIPYSKRAEAIFNEIKALDADKQEKQDGSVFFHNGIPVTINPFTHTAYPASIIRNGTSWATPRRAGEYTKYLMLKDLL